VADVGLAEARERARELAGLVSKGQDPRRSNGATHAHGSPQEPTETTGGAPSFADVAADYIQAKSPGWRGDRTVGHAKVMIRHASAFSHMPVGDITHVHIDNALQVLRHRHPPQARRTLGLWYRIFAYAMARGYREPGLNPAQWRDLHSHFWPYTKSVVRPHFAAMDYRQILEFMARLRVEHTCSAKTLEFLILTAARTSEVLGMRWNEINFDTKVWTLPATRSKTSRQHEVPLSDRAVEILNQQRAGAPNTILVFPGRRLIGQPPGPFNPQILRTALKSIGFTKLTVHGFRSSFRTWGGEQTEYQREIIEMCLAHQVGNAVERAYWRSTALDKRRVVMNAWASYCSSIAL
jgi:integrase